MKARNNGKNNSKSVEYMGLSQPLEPPICERNLELMRLHGNNECRPWHKPKVTGENRKSRNKLWGQHRNPLNPMKFHIPHFPSLFPWNLKQPLENSASLKMADGLSEVTVLRDEFARNRPAAVVAPRRRILRYDESKMGCQMVPMGPATIANSSIKTCIRVFHFGVFKELEWNDGQKSHFERIIAIVWREKLGFIERRHVSHNEHLWWVAGWGISRHHGWLPWLPSPVVLMAAWNMAVPEISEMW